MPEVGCVWTKLKCSGIGPETKIKKRFKWAVFVIPGTCVKNITTRISLVTMGTRTQLHVTFAHLAYIPASNKNEMIFLDDLTLLG